MVEMKRGQIKSTSLLFFCTCFHNTIRCTLIRLPGNPVNGRGGSVDAVDMTCELIQVVYIVITAIILVRERSIKVINREQLR